MEKKFLIFIGTVLVYLSWDMQGCRSHWKKWELWLRNDSCDCGSGSLLQTGGAGEEVCWGRCLLVQTFPLSLRVSQFLTVPTNPGTPEERNQIQLPGLNAHFMSTDSWCHTNGCSYTTIYACTIFINNLVTTDMYTQKNACLSCNVWLGFIFQLSCWGLEKLIH